MTSGCSNRIGRITAPRAVLGAVIFSLWGWMASPAHLSAQPAMPPVGVDQLRTLTSYLNACLQRQVFTRASVDREVAFRFSLNTHGALIGAPRITYLRTDGSDPRLFLTDLQTALKACLPVPLSQSLGAAVAGRPLSMKLILHAKKELSI